MEESASVPAEVVFDVRFVREAILPDLAPKLDLLGPGQMIFTAEILRLECGGRNFSWPLNRVGNVLRNSLRIQFQVARDDAFSESQLCVFEVLDPSQTEALVSYLPMRFSAEVKERLLVEQRRSQVVSPLFDGRPGPAISVLLALNILVFVWMMMNGADLMRPAGPILIDSGSNFGPLTLNGQWWRLLSCAFVHIGIIHIGVNMLALWNLGRFMERAYGTAIFLVIYLSSALLGSLLSVFMNPLVNSAGASGAICGLGGALLAFCLRRRAELPSLLVKGLRNNALQFIGLTALIGFGIPGIDNFAHLGGFLGGLLLGAIGSLPLEAVARKAEFPRRLALTLISSLLLVGAAGFFLYNSSATQVARFLSDFEKQEARASESTQAALQKLTGEQDQNRRNEVALDLEKNCLPILQNLRLESEKLPPPKLPAAKKQLAEIQRYLVSREKELQLRIRALRNNDRSLWEQAEEEFKQWAKKT